MSEGTASGPFRVGFVPGVTPDKWARAWRDREPDPLDLTLVGESEQYAVLTDGRVEMCFVRLAVLPDGTGQAAPEGLHLIRLYRERPVVVVGREHPAAAYDEIPLDDLGDEQFVFGRPADFEPSARQLDWPAMTVKEAVEVVAAGSGVAVMPMSLARLHHRKDVTAVPVLGAPETEVGLAWLRDADDPRTDTFVGVVRGRTARSSRGGPPPSGGSPSTAGAAGAAGAARGQRAGTSRTSGRRRGGPAGGRRGRRR